MPANVPYSAAGLPQFAQSQQSLNLPQSIQQINQSQGTVAPKIPWALSKAEKKQYDQIFRAWDTAGSGFITGETALRVFGQSGLDKNDLARVWYVISSLVVMVFYSQISGPWLMLTTEVN